MSAGAAQATLRTPRLLLVPLGTSTWPTTASRATMAAVGPTHVRTVSRSFDDPLPGTELGAVEYAITRAEGPARRPGPGGSGPASA